MKALNWLFSHTIGGLVANLRFWWGTRRSAKTTIRLIKERNESITIIIDAGCNNSQWSRYLYEEWPTASVYSIDGNPKVKPIGKFLNVALGSSNGEVKYTLDGTAPRVDGHGTITVPMRRLDSLICTDGFENTSTLLKVDCESHIYDTLVGCGQMLLDFDYVLVEMVNNAPGYASLNMVNHNMDVIRLMLDAGFNQMEVTDATVWPNGVDYVDCLFMRNTK